MRNCFNNILIALNICDSLHLIFAIMDAVRNSFGEKNFRNILGKYLREGANPFLQLFKKNAFKILENVNADVLSLLTKKNLSRMGILHVGATPCALMRIVGKTKSFARNTHGTPDFQNVKNS